MGSFAFLVLAGCLVLAVGQPPPPPSSGSLVKLRTKEGKCGGEAFLADGQTVKLLGLRRLSRRGRCDWSVSGTDADMSLEVRCPLFDVPWSENCAKNRLTLGDITGKMETLCGRGKKHLLINSNRMWASYIHRRRAKSRGFQCMVTATRRNKKRPHVGNVDSAKSSEDTKAKVRKTVVDVPSTHKDPSARAASAARVTAPAWSQCQCGVSSSGNLSHPWLASISINYTEPGELEIHTLAPYCSGAVINSHYILTAAQCVTNDTGAPIPPSALQVGLGNRDMLADGVVGTAQIFSIQEVIVHRNYLPPDRSMDIALLRTTQELDLGQFTPICLASNASEKLAGQTATLAGLDYLTGLWELEVAILEPSECKSFPNVAPDTLCAEYPRGDWPTCLGDTGGPLTVTKEDKNFMVGITSYGWDCKAGDSEGVYTNVASFHDWILSHTADSTYCDGATGSLLL